MKFIWTLAILCLTNAAHINNTAESYIDVNAGDSNLALWKHLFIKLDRMSNETEKLSQNIANLDRRYDVLSLRQEELMESVHKLQDYIGKRQEQLVNTVHNVQEVIENRLATQAHLIRKSFNHSQTWTTILRRQDGSVNFNRNWDEYSKGFGNTSGEFFIGLENLHIMTTFGAPHELLIVLRDFYEQTRYAKYDLVRIGSETEKYALMELGSYSGDAHDSLRHHKGHKFSTSDQDNSNGAIRDCAKIFESGWWFSDPCYMGNLHGPYRSKAGSNMWGVSWGFWQGWNVSMKFATMMIRPKL